MATDATPHIAPSNDSATAECHVPLKLTEDERTAKERRGKCDQCESRGPLFQTPTGHNLCFACTGAYISWEMDDGRLTDPEMWSWLWEDDDAD